MYSVTVKMVRSGRKWIFVPRFLVVPVCLQLGNRNSLGVRLLVGMQVFPDLDVEFFAERVHAGDANAVESARDLVVGGIELAPGMQLGEHYLQGRHPLATRNIHLVHRNPAPVVGHGDRVVDVDDYVYVGCIAGQRFIDGVIHHLIHQVMQTLVAG